MGQARNRGNLEQRIEQAREKFEATIEQDKQDIVQMEALEKRQREGLQHWVDSQVIPALNRKYGPMMTADLSILVNDHQLRMHHPEIENLYIGG